MALALVVATAIGTKLASFGFPLPVGKRIGCVDGLRGYLAIFVMFHHYTIWLRYNFGHPWADPALNFYNQLGKAAVALFFMATGLVFYPRVVSGLRANNWTSMYNGRFFRIVPMLLVSTLSSALIVAVEYRVLPDRHFPIEVIKWLAGKQGPLMGVEGSNLVNAGVLWSIWWEWVFYFAILPLVATLRLAFKRDTLWVLLLLLLALSLLGRFTGHEIFKFIPLFIFGMLTGEAVSKPYIKHILSKRWMVLPVLMALIAGMTLFHEPYGLVPMCLFAFVFLSVAGGNDLVGLLSTRGARILGEISFSIYVIHGIVLYVAFRIFHIERVPVLNLPVLAICAVLASALCFLGIEKPGMALGKWFYPRLQAQLDRVLRGSNGSGANDPSIPNA